ncbi:hypothetical protein ACH4UM_38200 [Streptomyces sp. NPDC020801]|uniref:hypothetical protein n=1 Tax=unclassified Streptomyces TaxID=2593676 RepID=UPI0037A627B3
MHERAPDRWSGARGLFGWPVLVTVARPACLLRLDRRPPPVTAAMLLLPFTAVLGVAAQLAGAAVILVGGTVTGLLSATSSSVPAA